MAPLACLLARFAVTGLYRIYKFLFTYFLVVIGGSLVLTQTRFGSHSYTFTYMGVEAVMHLLAILAVLEMYGIALAKHPGLAGFGRAGLLAAALLAIAIAAVGVPLDRDVPSGQLPILQRFLTLERSLDVIIVVFLMLIALFITWFPIELSRNTSLVIGGSLVFYLTRGAGLLLVNLSPAHLPAINDVLLSISASLIAIWAAVLRSEKVSEDAVTGHFWDPAAMERLTRQLDAINAALVRFVRQ
jgi:hypothetical protein